MYLFNLWKIDQFNIKIAVFLQNNSLNWITAWFFVWQTLKNMYLQKKNFFLLT